MFNLQDAIETSPLNLFGCLDFDDFHNKLTLTTENEQFFITGVIFYDSQNKPGFYAFRELIKTFIDEYCTFPSIEEDKPLFHQLDKFHPDTLFDLEIGNTGHQRQGYLICYLPLPFNVGYFKYKVLMMFQLGMSLYDGEYKHRYHSSGLVGLLIKEILVLDKKAFLEKVSMPTLEMATNHMNIEELKYYIGLEENQ